MSREVTVSREQVAGDEMLLPPCSMAVVQW